MSITPVGNWGRCSCSPFVLSSDQIFLKIDEYTCQVLVDEAGGGIEGLVLILE